MSVRFSKLCSSNFLTSSYVPFIERLVVKEVAHANIYLIDAPAEAQKRRVSQHASCPAGVIEKDSPRSRFDRLSIV